MKLKKLIAVGFKSFADRTEFEFDAVISCIVGPNGCGKSNVVDAIKWVLGEQSAKSLRGSEMMDVIFNGSSARRASGRAEVSLVFDNADGTLRPDADAASGPPPAEVSITRRLFRSGQSEYLINKTTCRLKDIREMFLDTGIGTKAYGVIEQGQVEGFLQGSHEERRNIFDEAAGISRYKARKKEALRKLERVEQNLLRLIDVLNEAGRQLRSIKYQAGKARSYQSYSERLTELKSLHFLSQYHQLSSKRLACQGKLDHGTDSLSAIATRIDQLSVACTAAEAEAEDLERNARELQVRIATVGGQITTWQERSDAHAGRMEEYGNQIVTLAGRAEELEAKVATFQGELAQQGDDLTRTEALALEMNDRYESLHEAHQGAQMAISGLQAELEDEKNGTMDLIRRASQFHNEVHASTIRQDNLASQQTRLSGRAKEIADALGGLLVEQAQTQARHNDVESTLEATKVRLAETNEENRRAIESEHEIQGELSTCREQRSALQSRAAALDEMQRRLEGVGKGVKRVLEARGKGQLACIRGMLGEFVHADVEHAPLIEAALGGADQQLIAERYDELAAVRDDLAAVLGDNASAQVWCIDRVAVPQDDFTAAAHPAVLARAIDWVQFEDWLAPVIKRVLGRTLVVATLADAKAVADAAPAGYRFVTQAGEVVEADGRVRIGCANRGAGVVTRRSELADLKVRGGELDTRITELADQCQSARGQCEHIERVLQGLRTAVYEDSMELTTCKGRLEKTGDQIASFQREEPVISKDLEQVAVEAAAAVQAEQDARQKAEELERLNIERQEHIQILDARIVAARQELSTQREEITEAKVARGQAAEKARALKDARAALTRQCEQMTRDMTGARNEMELVRQRRIEAEAAIEKARGQIDELYTQHKALSNDAEDVEESRTGIKQRVDEIRANLSEQRKAHEKSGDDVNALRVRISEVDANIGNLITRAAEDMGMDLMTLAEDYAHDDERDWDGVAAEVRELDGKIKRLGNVNLDAITEQEELEARHNLYEGQIKDVQDSHKQLNELIKHLNHESRQLFIDTFEAVRENFQTLFRKLFGGGRADILLTDPDDVLESGIDIVVMPPGKELRSLSLLSGGEKTMTALALLFSIFKSKPSPFCLLDEVDAALDEANTERFAKLVREFNQTSQFIVITHAKRTMSMANVLYGVTMQERGVSKRISVRFEDADSHLDEELEPVGA